MATRAATSDLYGQNVLATYARFPVALERGEGTRVWDEDGRAYLDFTSGIAVNSLGHAHPAMQKAIAGQAARLIHVSNLFLNRPQAELAAKINAIMGMPGRIFFCNSGAEANEGLYKLARKHGSPQRRNEIITLDGSFHGRTLGGIAATGQIKVKLGFGPPVEGFINVPARIECVANAAGPRAAAVLVEPIQGEGGVKVMPADFLRALRELCDERGMLLLYDEVQCGLGRTGHWHGWHATGAPDAAPDAISWAKGIGGGFPLGAFWLRENLADLLGPGTHGTTYGGSPLACAAARCVLDTIEKEDLLANAREHGARLRAAIDGLKSPLVEELRGAGLLLGVALRDFRWKDSTGSDPRPPALRLTLKLIEHGLLVVPAGENVIRLLPPLNVTGAECDEAVGILREVLAVAGPAS
ncbi:MAG: aminotransferase class III-fold pyridoxal phosphate-dependent enzyme [Chthoniobacterales bacterium]|nr:aminotransferase class III-fold pyridoxal phosphate-dependent enzyme [Chthoniobacterales bacterium]